MMQNSITTIPCGNSRFAVLKEKKFAPTANDDFLKHVFISFFKEIKSMDIPQEDANMFINYINDCKKRMSTNKTVLEFTKNKPFSLFA